MNFICIDFINSSWYKSHKEIEVLRNPKWLEHFKEKWNIKLQGMPDIESEAELLQLRELLTDMLDSVKSGTGLSEEAVASLNKYLSMAAFTRRIIDTEEGYRIANIPENQNWQWVASEIAASFMDLISNYEIGRIKHCENPECSWIFYDESKSRTRRWCGDTCGSLMKVRRFRERKRQG